MPVFPYKSSADLPWEVGFSAAKPDHSAAYARQEGFTDRSHGTGCWRAKLVHPGTKNRLVRPMPYNAGETVTSGDRITPGHRRRIQCSVMSRTTNIIIVVLFIVLAAPALASSTTTELSENSRLEFIVANAGHQPGHALVSSETLLSSSEPLGLTTSVCSVAASVTRRIERRSTRSAT